MWLLPLLCGGFAVAHDIHPAYLQITETAEGAVQLLWRQPVDAAAHPAIPSLSSAWLDSAPASRELTDQTLTLRWQVPPPHVPVAGQQLRVSSRKDSPTDVLVQVSYADGRQESAVLGPSHPQAVIGQERAQVALSGYFLLGIEHIATGYDHLLYLLGLVLLVGSARRLAITVTAFTVAHSITLACAALGMVRLDPAAIEVAIALSILYVAVELRRGQQGQSGLGRRWPWLVGFGFGLLHGFGFAGALSHVGLPDDAVAVSLLKFNLGVEVGQLCFVAVATLLLALLAARSPRLHRSAVAVLPICIGTVAAYWVIERLAVMV